MVSNLLCWKPAVLCASQPSHPLRIANCELRIRVFRDRRCSSPKTSEGVQFVIRNSQFAITSENGHASRTVCHWKSNDEGSRGGARRLPGLTAEASPPSTGWRRPRRDPSSALQASFGMTFRLGCQGQPAVHWLAPTSKRSLLGPSGLVRDDIPAGLPRPVRRLLAGADLEEIPPRPFRPRSG